MKKSGFFMLLQLLSFFVVARNKVELVTASIDLTQRSGKKLTPVWPFFGYDEANYA